MSGTTDIRDLPAGPQEGTPPNIQLHTKENTVIDNPMQALTDQRNQQDSTPVMPQGAPPNPSEYMKQVVSDVQTAGSGGNLNLPARDIPVDSSHIMQDQQIKANYIPDQQEDYIQKFQTTEEVVRVNQAKQSSADYYDGLYDEFRTPILILFLYVVLQLPVVNKTIGAYLPMLVKSDGNPNLKGHVFSGVCVASLYYVLMKGVHYFAI